MGYGNLDRILIWGGKKLENTFLGQFRKLEQGLDRYWDDAMKLLFFLGVAV